MINILHQNTLESCKRFILYSTQHAINVFAHSRLETVYRSSEVWEKEKKTRKNCDKIVTGNVHTSYLSQFTIDILNDVAESWNLSCVVGVNHFRSLHQ